MPEYSENRTFEMADGAVYIGNVARDGDYVIYLWPEGDLTIVDIATIFGDPEKTKKIISRYQDTETVYQDYTILRDISIDTSGNFMIKLVK